MAFRFRLEKVLSVRRIREEEAHQRMADARERLARAQGEVEGLEARIAQAHQDLDALKRRDELSSEALYLHGLHMAGLRRELARAREELAVARREADEAHARLVEAHRDREALERLREREERQWERDQARRESRRMDEVALTRHRSREEENHGP